VRGDHKGRQHRSQRSHSPRAMHCRRLLFGQLSDMVAVWCPTPPPARRTTKPRTLTPPPARRMTGTGDRCSASGPCRGRSPRPTTPSRSRCLSCRARTTRCSRPAQRATCDSPSPHPASFPHFAALNGIPGCSMGSLCPRPCCVCLLLLVFARAAPMASMLVSVLKANGS
jgi:hypothetical protein